mgnify:CR=1 FL=1
MKRNDLEQWAERFVLNGAAFLPENIPDVGDGLRLLLEDGGMAVLAVSANRFLRAVAFYYGADVAALRRRYGAAIGRKQLVPLPLAADWVIVPFKVRNPIGRQVVHGWFVAQHIRRLTPAAPQRTRLELSGSHAVTVHHSWQFCQAQMRHVRLVRDFYAEIHYGRGFLLAMEPNGGYGR